MSKQNKEIEDKKFMQEALRLARKAFSLKEVPVGAIVVQNQRIISRAYNQRERKKDPLCHAELIAIQKAARKLRSWRLLDCTLYVTLEPCAMCAGAIVLSRIKRIVFGATDPKAGACGSVMNILTEKKLNHQPQITSGISAEECSQILKSFFKELRNKRNRKYQSKEKV